MNDSPSQIASDLISQHGVDGALLSIRDGIATAHADGDNYRLSILREVRRGLQDKPGAVVGQTQKSGTETATSEPGKHQTFPIFIQKSIHRMSVS